MRQRCRNSCRPFGTSGAPSSRTTGSRPWLHRIVHPGLNHSPRNHVDGVPPMVSLIKILNGVARWGSTTSDAETETKKWSWQCRTPLGFRGFCAVFPGVRRCHGDPWLCCKTPLGLGAHGKNVGNDKASCREGPNRSGHHCGGDSACNCAQSFPACACCGFNCSARRHGSMASVRCSSNAARQRARQKATSESHGRRI